MTNVIIFGPPGAGKGTQAEYLEKEFGIVQVSTGAMLRDAISKGDPRALEAKKYMDAGALVPDAIMIDIIKNAVVSHDSFTLDGFPRNREQVIALDKMLASINKKIDHIFLLDVNEPDLVERISGRFSCKKCGTGYHDKYKPTKKEGECDKKGCGSTEFKRRSDDTPDKLKVRLEEYRQNTKPAIDYYEGQGRLEKIDGNRDMGAVFESIATALVKARFAKAARPSGASVRKPANKGSECAT